MTWSIVEEALKDARERALEDVLVATLALEVSRLSVALGVDARSLIHRIADKAGVVVCTHRVDHSDFDAAKGLMEAAD